METISPESPRAPVKSQWPGKALFTENQTVRQDDLLKALALAPYWEDEHGVVYVLPDAPWGHRSSHCLNALLARLEPARANAVLRPKESGHYAAKIHASAEAPQGTRAKRWMIDPLPASELDHFIQAFSACHWGALRTPVFRAWQ